MLLVIVVVEKLFKTMQELLVILVPGGHTHTLFVQKELPKQISSFAHENPGDTKNNNVFIMLFVNLKKN